MSVRWLILGVLRFYQKCVSPILPKACRFYPTCSSYTTQAIDKYGITKGVVLGIKRIARCHPFHAGGFDPVP